MLNDPEREREREGNRQTDRIKSDGSTFQFVILRDRFWHDFVLQAEN